MPCTTILVGKCASYDGSTLMARNEDAGAGSFAPKKYTVVLPEQQPKIYRSVISKVEIPLPEEPMRYTSMPNALPDAGIWGEAGFNAENIAMSETETITTNARVLGADPLVAGGIGEEDMLTIVLPYIHSAREGVLRLGQLLKEYGTYEMNGIGFQDMDEIWWLETLGGHHWLAKRVPDNAYVVVPNQRGIDTFDFKDAFSAQKDYMCSEDLIAFVKENHLDLEMTEVSLEERTDFDARAAFGSKTDHDHCYNTPRAWFMLRWLNPNTYIWDGEQADYTPYSDQLPWSLVPERKVTIEDIKYVLSSYYQGTRYNPYGRFGDLSEKGKLRPIGINRNNFVKITQLRPYVPKAIAAVEWIAEGSNAFNAAVPFYGNVTDTPAYLRDTTSETTTENFYWANRIIGALADAHYSKCMGHVEQYQKLMAAEGHKWLRTFDRTYMDLMGADAGGNTDTGSDAENTTNAYLNACNEQIAAFARKETYALLDKVLYTASMGMRNAYAKDDAQ